MREPPSNLTLSCTRSFSSHTSLIVRFRRGLELASIGRIGDVIMLEQLRERKGEAIRENLLSPHFSEFEGVERWLGWNSPYPEPPCPSRSTAPPAKRVQSMISPLGADQQTASAASSSPLHEGEGRSWGLLGGGASGTTGGFIVGVEFVLVEATEAAERRLFSALAKPSSPPFESDMDPTERRSLKWIRKHR